MKANVLDIYYSLGLGYEIELTSDYPGTWSRFRASSYLGLRWYFNPKIALNTEVGYGTVAPFNVGIAFKL